MHNSETDMYADDTAIWSSLNNANCCFSHNEMKPNAKKNKQMLIGTAQKLRCADKTCMFEFSARSDVVSENPLGYRQVKCLAKLAKEDAKFNNS